MNCNWGIPNEDCELDQLNTKFFRTALIIIASLILACGASGRREASRTVALEPDAFSAYKAYDHFVKGDLYEQSGNLDSAAEEYRRALIFDPGSLEIRRILSEVYFQQRKFDEAAILRSEISEKKAEDYNFIADCLRYNKDLESAASFYIRSLELDSTQYVTRLYLAKILQFLGRNHEAESHLKRLVKAAPGKADVYLELADFYISTKELDKALDFYYKAAAADTNDLRPLVGLAALYLAQDDTLKADSLYFDMARRNWDDPEFLNSIIVSFYNIRAFSRAEQMAARIVELLPGNMGALKRYSMILYGNQKFPLAESLMTAIELEAGADAPIFYYLARMKQEKEDLAGAEEYFQKSLALVDTLIDSWINLALVIDRQERYAEALRVMGEAMATIPEDSNTILFFTALIHSQNDHYDLARDGYQRLIASEPENIGVRFNLGAAFERLGQFDNAEREFKHIIEKDPRNALALNYLGYMYADRNLNLGEARKLIERALAIDPDNGAFLDSYAWVLYRMGKYEEALAQMKLAIQSQSDDPVVYDHQGDIYLALDQEDLARQCWSRALELKPDDEAIRSKLNPR